MAHEPTTGARGLGRRSGRGGRGQLGRTLGRRPGDRGPRASSRTATGARPRLTGRAALLVLVVAVLVVSYASSLRAYLEQRQQIRSLQQSISTSQEHISALQREKRRWRDPAYVVAQARARFAFGFPGEIGYRVLDADGRPLDPDGSLTQPDREGDAPEWWETTLASIDAAGHPPRTSAPADRITAPPQPQQDR